MRSNGPTRIQSPSLLASPRVPGEGALQAPAPWVAPSGSDARLTRWNHTCAIFALLWLLIVPSAHHATYQDLSAFYLASVVARTHQWGSLYPTPPTNKTYFIGEQGDTPIKPGMARLIHQYHVLQWCPCVNPPWQAIALLPMAWLTFAQAHRVLLLLNGVCLWGVALAGGRSYERCARHHSRLAGCITLLIACSPLAYRAIRVQNLTPIVALCIAITVWDLLGRWGTSGLPGGLAAAWGVLAKLAPAVLFPLAIAMRRWRTIAWATAFFAAVVVATWRTAGTGIFREYFQVVAPTLTRSSAIAGNKSLQAFLLRVTAAAPLPAPAALAFHTLQWATAALLAWLLFGPRPGGSRHDWTHPAPVFAAATASLTWLLIFSPLAWEHYYVYLCPFWGWLLWEGTFSRPRRILGIAAIALTWFPLPGTTMLQLREPWNSYMLFGGVLMLILAVQRLAERASDGISHNPPNAPSANASS